MAFKNIYASPKLSNAKRAWPLRVWALLATVVSILIVGVVALCWRPAGRAWHGHKSRELAQQAQSLMKDGKWAEAAPLLEKAYLTDPSEPTALRACAYYEAHGAGNPAFSGHFLRQLVAVDAADATDKAALGKSLVAAGRTSEASKLRDSLPPSERGSKEGLELDSQLARKQGETAKADALLRRAMLKEPEDPASVLRLALMDLDSPVEEIEQDAWDRLWKLANTAGQESIAALDRIATRSITTAAQSAGMLDLVSKKESVPPMVRYHVVGCYIRRHLAEHDVMLDKEASRVTGKPDDEVEAFCRWLTDEDEYERVFKFLPVEAALKSARFLPFHVNALMHLGKWQNLHELLQDSKSLHLDALAIAELKAKCARGMNEPPSVIRDFLEQGREFAVAARNTSGLDRFADVALSLSYPDIALECLKDIAPASQAQREKLLERIMNIQRSTDDMTGLLSTLRDVVASPEIPNDRVEEFIYLRLISGVELETVMEDCAVYASKGRIRALAYDFFKALAAYRFQDEAGLKAALSVIDPKSLPANWRAVVAGLLSETGEKAKAFQLAEKIQGNILTADEKAVFATAL